MFPHQFDLSRCAGAPPDMYSSVGQDWGLPLYNWPEMKHEGFRWWKERLRVAEELYHLYRLDHVVGFYRIWAIPKGLPATQGAFEPADEKLWILQGEELLRMMLECCEMMPIAEDLGTVPDEVKLSLHKLGICGTKVLRWERFWSRKSDGMNSCNCFISDELILVGYPFVPLEMYNVDSMSTVGTHDSELLKEWWTKKDNGDAVIEYCKCKGWPVPVVGSELTVQQHLEILQNSHRTPSLFHINPIQEYFAAFDALRSQDSGLCNSSIPKLSQDDPRLERVNVPGTVSDFNWTYRFRLTLEETMRLCLHGFSKMMYDLLRNNA